MRSLNPLKTMTEVQSVSRYFIFGWLTAFIFLFLIALLLNTWFETVDYQRTKQELMRGTVSSVARQMSFVVDKMHRDLELFVVQERDAIAQLSSSELSEERFKIWKGIDSKLSVLFSGGYSFLLTDIDQISLLSLDAFSNQTETERWFEITEQNLVVGCRVNQDVIEVSAYWNSGTRQGILLLCSNFDVLNNLLMANIGSDFDLLLLERATKKVLSSTHQYEENSLLYKTLSSTVRNKVAYSLPVIGGPWELVALPKDRLFEDKLLHNLINAGLVFLIFCGLSGLLAYNLLVSDRRRIEAERAWVTLQERAALTLESIDDGVIVTDIDTHVYYMNPVAERITGWELADAESMALETICPVSTELLMSLDESQTQPALLMGEEALTAHYHIVIERDGHVIHVEQSAQLTASKDAEKSIVWVLRDVTEARQAMEELSYSEERYRLLAENVNDVILTLDLELQPTYLSPSVKALLGYDIDTLLIEDNLNIFPGDTFDLIKSHCERLLQSSAEELNLQESLEISAYDVKGNQLWLELSISLMRNQTKSPIGLLVIARDVTRRHESESQLQLTSVVFENSFEGILVTDARGRIIRTNKAFTKITGYLFQEVKGKNARILQSGRHAKNFFTEMWASLKKHGVWHGEIWNRRRSGDIYPQRLSISTIRDRQGRAINYIGVFADITDKKESEERIHRLAYYDDLTTLPNRSLFHEQLKHAMARARRNQLWVGLLFIDLDRFKAINDSLGHPAGDELLELTAKRLMTCIREEDTVARMGGDEFTLVLSNMKPMDGARRGAANVADKVLNVLSDAYSISGREVYIGASIGIAFYPQDASEASELVKNADLALYQAKSEGKHNFQFYSKEMNQQLVARLELENDLRRAVHADELKIYYQPQVDINTGELTGLEALLRWYCPQRGVVLPKDFIPAAEETGLINTIGEWCLLSVCQQAVLWQEQGYNIPKMAVNLSAKQFIQPKVVDLVKLALGSTGLAPGQLELELTESILVEDFDLTIATFSELKQLGVRLSIDDFGTGYSSLNYLKRLPIDALKIDQSFVRDITEDADDAEVIAAIIAIAHNLKLGVIAEGVETRGQLEFLRFHQCNEIQGFLVSKPLNLEEMHEKLAQKTPFCRLYSSGV